MDNNEKEYSATIKIENVFTHEDIINKIADETNISEKEVREVLEEMVKVIRS